MDYVLDGQQRLTSVFAIFQTQLATPPPNPEVWLPIFYDFDAEDDAQQTRFVALDPAAADPAKHFALNAFFDPAGFAMRRAD